MRASLLGTQQVSGTSNEASPSAQAALLRNHEVAVSRLAPWRSGMCTPGAAAPCWRQGARRRDRAGRAAAAVVGRPVVGVVCAAVDRTSMLTMYRESNNRLFRTL